MRITFVATRKNLDPTERELYEMDMLNRALGFKRAFLDLGIQTVMAPTPRDVDVQMIDEYLQPISYDTRHVVFEPTNMRRDELMDGYVFESYDFAVFLRRFSSSRKAENYRTFDDPSRWDRIAEGATWEDTAKLNVMQWQNPKAVKRTKHTLPVIR